MAREVDSRAGRTQRLRRGMAFLQEARFEKAIAELQPLAGRSDLLGRTAERHLSAACKQAALAHLRAGRLPQAEAHLRRAVALLGPRGDLQDALAEVHARAGRYDLAAEELQRSIPQRAGDPTAWRKLAQALWRAGRRADAHLVLQEAVGKLGDRAELHLQKGLFYAAEDCLAEARRSFTRAVEADPDCAEACRYLGLSAAATGHHREAVESLQHAAELAPQQPLVMYELALASRCALQAGIGVSMRLGQLRPAAPNAEDAALPAELVEAALKGFEGRGDAEIPPSDRRQLEALLGAMRAAMARPAARPDLHGSCADALELLGRSEEALWHARQAAGGAAPASQTLIRLGKLCAKLGRREEAVEHLEAAVAGGADWADVHALLAECLAELGRTPQARTHLEQALKLNANLRLAEGLRSRLAA
jgi:Flp pilus assembly protein TadD